MQREIIRICDLCGIACATVWKLKQRRGPITKRTSRGTPKYHAIKRKYIHQTYSNVEIPSLDISESLQQACFGRSHQAGEEPLHEVLAASEARKTHLVVVRRCCHSRACFAVAPATSRTRSESFARRRKQPVSQQLSSFSTRRSCASPRRENELCDGRFLHGVMPCKVQ